MIALLLRLYPARWRARYGDEFAAVLGERPLGPFDVADVLLGALDAHLHLRGLGAASQHAKGFAMSLRIGGYAAIVGGILWFVALAGKRSTTAPSRAPTSSAVRPRRGDGRSRSWRSSASARSRRAAIPCSSGRRSPSRRSGADRRLARCRRDGRRPGTAMPRSLVAWTRWMISTLGLLTLLVGSGLFAIATWRTRALSPWRRGPARGSARRGRPGRSPGSSAVSCPEILGMLVPRSRDPGLPRSAGSSWASAPCASPVPAPSPSKERPCEASRPSRARRGRPPRAGRHAGARQPLPRHGRSATGSASCWPRTAARRT